MGERLSRMLWLWAAALFLSLSAWGQTSTTGVVEGRVRDQAGTAVADATVTGVAKRAPAATVTDSEGRYTLQNLPPGIYKVRVEAPGKAAVILDSIVVSINTRTRVDVTMVAGQTETVTVTAEAPVVDTKSVTTGGNFKVDSFIDQVPIGRNLAASLTLAPGVQSGLGTGAGNYSISGSSGLENSYIVDGINITNTGYGGIGAYNSVYGSLGTGVTYDFLEEVQVKTGGIDVEFGQATGGVINTVVKTGTNDLSGKVALYTGGPVNEFKQASFFSGTTNLQKGDWSDSASYDLGLSVGGPIVKDKLFYFLAYNPTTQKQTAAVQDLALPASLAGTTQYPQAAEGTQTIERKSNNYAAKLTWYVNPNHRLELSGFGDPSTGGTGPQREFILPGGVIPYLDYAQGGGQSSIDYGGNNYTLKYDAVFTPTFFMQAQIGRKDAKFTESTVLNKSAYVDDRQLRCFLSPALCAPGQARDNSAQWAYGGVGFFSDSTDVNNQAKVVLTWAKGNNELKGGVSYDDISYTDLQNYSGTDVPLKFTRRGVGPGVCASDGTTVCLTDADCLAPGDSCDHTPPGGTLNTPCETSGVYAFNCFVLLDLNGGLAARERQNTAGVPQWRSNRGRFNPNPGPTSTTDLAVFLQDTFTFASRWTLKAGVRVSQQEISGTGVYTLNYHYSDGTPEISPPPNAIGVTPVQPGTYKFEWALAPRVGMTWDTRGDGRSKLYANLARYYERVPNDLAIRSLTNEADLGTTTFDGWDLALGQPTNQARGASVRGGQTTIADGTKLPYVDEYILGWQTEIGRDVSVEIRGIYREQGRVLEDVQFNSVEATENYYAGYYFGAIGTDIDRAPFPTDPSGPGGLPFGAYVLGNPGDNTPSGFPSANRTYKALEFILNKRYSDHWQLYGNLRFARISGNYEGLFRNDNGQSDPNITSLFDFPDSPLLHGQFVNGPLNSDVPYSLKLYGNYAFDNGLNVGAGFTWAGGVPRTPLLAHPNGFYQNSGELPGSNPVYYWYSTTNAATNCPGVTACFTTGSADQFFQDAGAVIPTSTYAFPHLDSSTLAKRGASGRTPDTTSLDLKISWQKKFNRWATFGVGAAVFNVLNFRETQLFDDNIEIQSGVRDPDYLSAAQFQTPRSISVFANWSF